MQGALQRVRQPLETLLPQLIEIHPLRLLQTSPLQQCLQAVGVVKPDMGSVLTLQ